LPWSLVSFVLSLCVSHGAAEELTYPVSVAVSESGAVFLADRNLPGVWRLEGDRLSLVFHASKKFRTPLNAVRCVAIDAEGKLLAGDSATRDVYRFDETGKPEPLTDQGEGYGQVGIPMDIVVDSEGDLLVSDLEMHRIVKIPQAGGRADVLAPVQAPRGLFYDSQKRLWVISGRKLLRLSPEGKQETIVDDGVFQFPHTVAVAEDGTAFVCDGYAKAIWKVAPGQKPEKWVSGTPLVNPVGMDIHQGTLFVVDPRARALFEIDAAGKLTRREAKPATE
jgi:sugar lactone lactonase YvrE